jgi:hypothetical protein
MVFVVLNDVSRFDGGHHIYIYIYSMLCPHRCRISAQHSPFRSHSTAPAVRTSLAAMEPGIYADQALPATVGLAAGASVCCKY